MSHAREPWPWIVGATLVSTIAVSLAFAWVAHRHPDALVVDDAYVAGLAWNAQQRAHAVAEQAGWELRLRAEEAAGGLDVRVSAFDASGARLDGARLGLRRERPSEGGYDADIALDADGAARVPLPRAGRWHLVATAERDGALLQRRYRVVR